MHTLIVLIGPTGVGKTELSLRLAEHFHTCIVSADSRQLYADLKIGTAAPTPEQLQRVQHHFVGTLKLTDYYSCLLYTSERALSRLRTFIYDKEHQKYIDDIASKRKTMVSTGDRSAKIRTYNYPQGRITDHRINYTIYNLAAFMDGDIQD